jgi:hypothetical protein
LEKLTSEFNDLTSDTRGNLHGKAPLSTTESRKSPAERTTALSVPEAASTRRVVSGKHVGRKWRSSHSQSQKRTSHRLMVKLSGRYQPFSR